MGPAVLPTLSSPEVSTIKGLLGLGAALIDPRGNRSLTAKEGGVLPGGMNAFPIPGLKLSYC